MSDIKSVRDHAKALEKVLKVSEKQVKILKACLRLECTIFDNWVDSEFPEGYPLAISYRSLGEDLRFLVLGHDEESMSEMASLYAKTRYRGNAVEPQNHDVSVVGKICLREESAYKNDPVKCVAILASGGYLIEGLGDRLPRPYCGNLTATEMNEMDFFNLAINPNDY